MSSRKRSSRKRRKSGRAKRFTVPPSVLAWATVLFCLFVISGGFYNILENPPPYLPYYNRVLTLDPRLAEQTVYESIFVFLTNAAMFLGFWLSYRSTQIAYDREKANSRLLLGIGFAAAGLFGNYLIYEMKKTVLG
jgi:uncharacterized membrane protein YfcA